MKKYFCVIVAFLLIVSLCSCSERKLTADEKEKLSKIYELGEGYDGSEELTLENIVYREPVFSSDSSVALKTKLLIGSVEKELVYQDTLYYPVGGETVH